ncbi:MAG: PDZ domain-containing protein [Planctomycetes bacterium]|nr:PDZ domain-containing protein [Planctomycetota bacterium]
MRSAPVLLLGIVLGVVVGAVGMALLDEGGPRPALAATRAATTERDPAGSSGPQVAEPASPAAEIASARIERGASTIEIPSELAEGVGDLLRRAPPRDAPAGDRTIHGLVSGPDGLPIAGALLRATRLGDRVRSSVTVTRPDAPPPAQTLEEKLRRTIADHYAAGGEIATTTTDADGRYRFERLRDGRYSVEAWCDRFKLFSTDGQTATEVLPDATLDWNGRRVARVAVEVLLPDGTRAPHALIDSRRRGTNDERGTVGWLAAEPQLALEPGEFELRATLGHPDAGPAWPDYLASCWTKAKLVEGAEPAAVTLTLAPQACLRGTVLLSTGGQPRQLAVRAKLLESGESADPERLRTLDNGEGTQRQAWVANGAFHFLEIPQGRWLVIVQRYWGSNVLAHAVVDVGAGTTRAELLIPELERADCIEVTVLDPDGGRVPTADLEWRIQRGSDGLDSDSCTTESRGPGLWWLPLEATRGLGFDLREAWPVDTRLYLLATSSEYGATVIEVFSTTRSVELRFGPPALLEVTVPGYVGSEHEGRVQLALSKVGTGISAASNGAHGAPSKEEGIARLGPVEAGTYQLSLWLNGQRRRGWNQVEAGSLQVTLSPGENRASLPVATLHSLTLRLPAGSEGGLQLESAVKGSNRRIWGQVDAKTNPPTALFEGVPAGDYRITWNSGPNPGVMSFSIPNCGTLVDWSPLPVNALRVTITDPRGELAQLGFADGDRITAVDGKAVAGNAELQILWTLARAQRQLALTVERDGEELRLEVEGKRLANQSKLGGQLELGSR